jgi:hypothetical protein
MVTMARWTLAALALALALGTARAEDACRADAEQLCQGIPPGGGRILACLRANQGKVSPGCKAELATVERKVKEVGAACGDDVRSWCADVKPGGGAVLRCLAQNRANLTPQCQEVLQGAQEKAGEFRQKCGGDAKKFCKGIAPGQGRILACLKSREADLSPACKPLFAR